VYEPQSVLTTGWTTGRLRFDPRQRQRIFPLASVSIPALRSTQPPYNGYRGSFPRGKSAAGAWRWRHPHLVPRSRMSRSYTSSPPSASVACSRTDLALASSKQWTCRMTDWVWLNAELWPEEGMQSAVNGREISSDNIVLRRGWPVLL
jgi:hypothetical protein